MGKGKAHLDKMIHFGIKNILTEKLSFLALKFVKKNFKIRRNFCVIRYVTTTHLQILVLSLYYLNQLKMVWLKVKANWLTFSTSNKYATSLIFDVWFWWNHYWDLNSTLLGPFYLGIFSSIHQSIKRSHFFWFRIYHSCII